MTIKIGEKTYNTRKPADLDAALIATTGCSAAEHARMLSGQPGAAQLAISLAPFIQVDSGSPPTVPELAAEIAKADDVSLIAQARALYSQPVEQLAPPVGAAAVVAK